ncbi:MAG: hypothetical protein EOO47_01620 [Flavobacterium sp.]|nr:MAG: hypothetical protein EOO47_01620 [Flavobacterium sp.]
MKLKSVGTQRPIYLEMGYTLDKGAFVWYKGQNEPIPLKIKSLTIDSSEKEAGQPNFTTYKWTEVYKGKAIGEYGFIEWPRHVDGFYYKRYSDGKVFNFEIYHEGTYDGKSMALVQNVQFHFYSFYRDSLSIVYPNGGKQQMELSPLPENRSQARYLYVQDYNFDGVDDIAFSVTDGEGLVVVFDVFIYNKTTKKFNRLLTPAGADDCGYLTNLELDKEKKQLSTTCKSGASWLGYTYKFNKLGKLVLVKGEE